VGRLVGAFKTRSTKEVNLLRHTPGARLWQRNFWERVIRDEFDLAKIREYMRGNAAAYQPRTYDVRAVRERPRDGTFGQPGRSRTGP
jgi:hypothetical protein